MKSFADHMADKMGAPPADDDAPDSEAGPDYGEGYTTAVSDFIDAVHSKDVEAAGEALKTAISLCPKEDGDEDESGGGHAALLLMPHGKGH